MGRYAAQTNVSSDKSKKEIERTLTRYGATGFMYGWQEDVAVIAFVFNGKQIKFKLDIPKKDDFYITPSGRTRYHEEHVVKAWEQATRQRWRALALVIKSKLEAVESGITTLEDEFLSWIVTPDGQQVRDHILPRLEEMYATGKMQKLLPAGTEE